MGLTEDERKAIVQLRLDNARQTLEDAKIIVDNKLWKAAANRLYYSELGDMYYKLFTLRQKGDYDDWIVVKESDIIPLIQPAEKFIAEIEKLIIN